MGKKNFLFYTFLLTTLLSCMQNFTWAQKQGQERIDSLTTVLHEKLSKNPQWADTNKVMLLTDLAYEYYMGDPEKGLEIADEALKLSEKLNWKKGIAYSCNRLGLCNWAKADYPRALELQFRALSIFEETNDKPGQATVLGNIGLVYYGQNDNEQSLQYHFKALNMNKGLGNKSGIARNLGNIGMAYDAQADYKHSLEYYFNALEMYKQLNDKNGVARNLGNIGFVYNELGDHIAALFYHRDALQMNRSLGNKILIPLNLGNIGEEYYNIATDTTARWKRIRPDSLNKANALANGEVYLLQAISLFKELDDYNSLQELYQYLSNLYAEKGNYQQSLETYKLYTNARDSIFNENNRLYVKKVESRRVEELHRKEIELKDLTIRKAKNERRYMVAGILMLCIISGMIFRQRHRIAKQKKVSENLLLNILPAETAEELKATGTAQAKYFEQVTVLFTDFRNFTAITEQHDAQELVNKIHHYYSAFDAITAKYNIEKIKTIGDSYMAAGGLPVSNNSHAEDTINAALAILEFMREEKKKHQGDKIFFDIRIGIHTGPVVAGIVGTRKFAYDIWGDTVNIASRMESSGEEGKINISGDTYKLVKDKFIASHRGKIKAKNKGEVDMYFVEGRN
ncbi:MAG: adenylate/guanylate cyclase domain-containing protein [Ferruginibacter sp.]